MPRSLSDWYTFAGAAEKLDINRSVITRAVAVGNLPTAVTADGKTRLIHKQDLAAWKSSAKAGRPKI